ISEIEGVIKTGSLKRGVREIIVQSHDGKMEKHYLIPYGKHIIVHDGEQIKAGDRITEGSITPQDILNILGPGKVQEYLVNEIQAVYRLQGVKINDKHIEVIVRQMLQKVRIEDPGDTNYLEGDQVDASRFIPQNKQILGKVVIEKVGDSRFQIGQLIDKLEFNRENRRLQAAELQTATASPARPAIYQPLLLGITQAALSTESFISAASFQETTRVLAEAAVERKVDFLKGLKENVIMGHLIPAGTGVAKYRNITVQPPEGEELLEFLPAGAEEEKEQSERRLSFEELLSKSKQSAEKLAQRKRAAEEAAEPEDEEEKDEKMVDNLD
ncbi:MAG: DNA-directed RNA polymerase subunit beta', partial [bacterium]